jgi:glucokinase
MDQVLSLDVGGTKLAAAVVDAEGRVRGRGKVPAPRTTDPDEFFEALLACAASAMRGADTAPTELRAIGCGCGGPMRWPEGAVSPLNIPAWRDFPLRERLSAEFDGIPVRVHNDAIALAAGEHWRGAGQGSTNMLAMTVSTGVGGGLVLGGRLYHGSSGNAGHVGHVIAEPDGPDCPCGGRGCVEAIASGPNAVKLALADGWKPLPGNEPGSGEAEADGHALAASAAAGDELAGKALARAGRAVGIALADSAAALDLEVAVISGGFSLSGPFFWDAVNAAFQRHATMAFTRAMRVVPSTLPGEAGLLGPAAFVLLPERYGWAVETGP